MQNVHKAGFVSIVGKPNVGKSTLMNRLVGEHLSIVTPKAQTTRHRIMGMLNSEDYQIVYSDTPGILEPKYALHEAMMTFVKVSLEDADAILLVVEWGESYDATAHGRFTGIKIPVLLIINKIDKAPGADRSSVVASWQNHLPEAKVLAVSSLTGENVDQILPALLDLLPEHPPYFPKDDLTNRSERFFASEIIREKIFMNYTKEVPYSTEVGIEDFKEDGNLLRIRATIFVERESQKGILIGKGGAALKTVGTEARKDMESFFGKKVFLETRVKVAADWRKQKAKLKHFGYLDY
ncbi:MAG: GTPase Era [Bacteroidetes bacterium]|nr:GTPase Era [Bacteroidota bacterium]MBS1977368.1 GTPase Era [Bacteroidota bacterium]